MFVSDTDQRPFQLCQFLGVMLDPVGIFDSDHFGAQRVLIGICSRRSRDCWLRGRRVGLFALALAGGTNIGRTLGARLRDGAMGGRNGTGVPAQRRFGARIVRRGLPKGQALVRFQAVLMTPAIIAVISSRCRSAMLFSAAAICQNPLILRTTKLIAFRN